MSKTYEVSHGAFSRSYIGQVDETFEPNGLGLEICYNDYVKFGYYKHGIFYNDLSSFGLCIFEEFKYLDWITTGTHKDFYKYVVAFGGDDDNGFNGILFYDNGDVLIIEGYNNSLLFPTGRGVKFCANRDVIYGEFQKGELTKSLSRKDFMNEYGWKFFDEELIDLKILDYQRHSKDSRLYFLDFVADNCVDSDIVDREFIYVKAVPLANIRWENGHIRYEDVFKEYFYFENDPIVYNALAEKFESHFIQIHLEDYTYTEGCVINIPGTDEKDLFHKNVHFHKKIFGWNCLNIVEWDPLTISQRLQLIEEGKYSELHTRELELDKYLKNIISEIENEGKDNR